MDTPKTSFPSLKDFHASIAECTKCELHKERTQVVPGSGNPKAKILFIGEAPGKNEDIKGVPFVGAAGKFLNTLLESIELEREDVFIANTVKCRPPKNRDPKKSEIATCIPYLHKQIEIIQPKIIVTLGRFAMNLFFPDKKIGEAHGTIQEKDGKKFLIMYHPAAALYNGSMRETLIKDFSQLTKFL
ncbi:uracil-DNA glycosylase [Candidatus Peregrinibacteria bacterium]|nr:MAG: uracil-DNA glycosylase [Candidatus Peregrinibacteria bacterium]